MYTPLKMNDFYTIDSSFKSLRDALTPAGQGARPFVAAAGLLDLQDAIQTSVLGAERGYKLRCYQECHVHLTAAKSNQVLMLARIDDTPEADMPAGTRTALRRSCISLGAALTERMVKAKTHADAVEQEAMRTRSKDASDDDVTPPSSPLKTATPRQGGAVSPPHGSNKRAPGGAHSPVLARSPSKRRKTEAASDLSSANAVAASPGTTTSTTTSTTTAVQSPPSYRTVPQLHIERDTGRAASFIPDPDSEAPAMLSPTRSASPQKMRALGPQAKPRPRSQLFIAPPDFTREVPASTTGPVSTAAPVAPAPGAAPHNADGRQQAEATSPDQRS
jgi:hypothetical protein